ncbi:hypothetical protein C0989_002432 [Termitomyces sp. Mn162]|nr:hypothetical protein C0989_002432 [Termitomyces sp. Mn162]
MGKKKSSTPSESFLLLPTPPSTSPIVDTHTHLASTFEMYRTRYKEGGIKDVHEFVKHMYVGRNVEAIVDVWCEAPVRPLWKTFADSALTKEDREKLWNGMDYWFVIEAMNHPRCVGWGEMGLDYHYDNSPRGVQQEVFIRQLRHAVCLGKPLTIHTREADADTERILKAERLLDHFPNLYIGITGVITYSTNTDTSTVIQNMAVQSQGPLRIVLETDAPYMVPANLYDSLEGIKGKLPLCHTAMVPWTAEFVARVAGEAWTAEKVMREARENARLLYGV